MRLFFGNFRIFSVGWFVFNLFYAVIQSGRQAGQSRAGASNECCRHGLLTCFCRIGLRCLSEGYTFLLSLFIWLLCSPFVPSCTVRTSEMWDVSNVPLCITYILRTGQRRFVCVAFALNLFDFSLHCIIRFVRKWHQKNSVWLDSESGRDQ